MTEAALNAYYEGQVKNGVALLDKKVPGWYDKIDTDILYIGSSIKCVMGQLFGNYSNGLEELGIECGSKYGFASSCEEQWIKAIVEKRAANPKPVEEPKYHWFAGLRHAAASWLF